MSTECVFCGVIVLKCLVFLACSYLWLRFQMELFIAFAVYFFSPNEDPCLSGSGCKLLPPLVSLQEKWSTAWLGGYEEGNYSGKEAPGRSLLADRNSPFLFAHQPSWWSRLSGFLGGGTHNSVCCLICATLQGVTENSATLSPASTASDGGIICSSALKSTILGCFIWDMLPISLLLLCYFQKPLFLQSGGEPCFQCCYEFAN